MNEERAKVCNVTDGKPPFTKGPGTDDANKRNGNCHSAYILTSCKAAARLNHSHRLMSVVLVVFYKTNQDDEAAC
jgi:hypothetical protein